MTTATGNSEFSALLAELEAAEPLAKSMGTDDGAGDEKIQAAAEEGASEGEGGEGEGEGNENGEGEGDETFGKSFQVTLANGTTAEVFDGTAMMKSLLAENAGLKEQGETLMKAMTAAIGHITDLRAVVGNQDAMIKSLRADFAKLAAQPAGRKAVLSVHEKPGPAGTEKPATLDRGEVMSKALSAQAEGRMTALQVSRLATYVDKRQNPPADLLRLAGIA